MKTCTECKKEFVPSSRHKICPSCRHRNKKIICSCGTKMAPKSTTCNSCTNRSNENNGNWRGGSTKHHAGYLMRKAPGHPRASSSKGYVFEHILVVEEHLGRYLLPGENVHHKNGIKDDNSVNNLELWTKPQPSGARAKDIYLWAKQIVELYEADLNKL